MRTTIGQGTTWFDSSFPFHPEIYSEDHDSSILGQSSNPVCGFSLMELIRLSAVLPTENWLGSVP